LIVAGLTCSRPAMCGADAPAASKSEDLGLARRQQARLGRAALLELGRHAGERVGGERTVRPAATLRMASQISLRSASLAT
jgi:hypothetical protein